MITLCCFKIDYLANPTEFPSKLSQKFLNSNSQCIKISILLQSMVLGIVEFRIYLSLKQSFQGNRHLPSSIKNQDRLEQNFWLISTCLTQNWNADKELKLCLDCGFSGGIENWILNSMVKSLELNV